MGCVGWRDGWEQEGVMGGTKALIRKRGVALAKIGHVIMTAEAHDEG